LENPDIKSVIHRYAKIENTAENLEIVKETNLDWETSEDDDFINVYFRNDWSDDHSKGKDDHFMIDLRKICSFFEEVQGIPQMFCYIETREEWEEKSKKSI
jgi:hypothetical protein